MSEFRRLHSFLAVAEHLNFRRAAEEVEVLVRFLVSDESATLTAGISGGAVPNR